MKKILLSAFLLLMTMISYGQEAPLQKIADTTTDGITLLTKEFSLSQEEQEAVKAYFKLDQSLKEKGLSQREIALEKGLLQLTLASVLPEGVLLKAEELTLDATDTVSQNTSKAPSKSKESTPKKPARSL